MNSNPSPSLFLRLLAALLVGAPAMLAQTTLFSYQGRLTDNGSPANGTYDFTFRLADALTAGNQIGSIVTNAAVPVSNGVFSVTLDFGAGAFNGANRWLEIGARTNGSAGAFTTLVPRQPVTPTPYAIFAYGANSVAAANVTGGFSLSQLPSVLLTNTQSGVVLNGTFFGNGAGLTNVVPSGGGSAVIWQTVSGTNAQAVANNGYIATDNSPVKVTLPLIANVGDIVKVAGMGSGGWKIAQNAGQSILISPSISGAVTNYTWTTNNSPLADTLAASADGSKLIAASTNGHLYTSTDFGVTWTERATNLGNPYWYRVASSSDGTKLVAVVYGGQIYTSADSGSNWTARASNKNWTSVASSSDGIKLIAVATNDFIYQSTNSGVAWFVNPSLWNGSPWSWTAVASSADGVKLYLGDGTGYISHSSNSGASFAGGTTDTGGVNGIACSADGTKVYVVHENNPSLTISYDSGITWTNRNIGLSAGKAVACSADGMRITAVGWYSILHSFNSGLTWYFNNNNSLANDNQGYWNAITLSADGTKAAIAKDFYGLSGPVLTGWAFATAPGTPGYLTGNQYSAVELLYVGGGQFLPVSYVNTITPH